MLHFFNCPECNQPCFTDEAESQIDIACECGYQFRVSADTHPFEMAGIEPEQA